jgi:hypothetical protein
MAVHRGEGPEGPARDEPGDGPHKVVEGRDGFLFLANDTNRVLDQHAGRLRFSRDELDAWRRLLEARDERVRAQGGRYVFAVAPDTPSVYPEKLPPGAVSVPGRPVHQLIDHLEREGSPVRVLYPADALAARKDEHQVFLRVDTHWTDFGAFVAYRSIVDALGAAVPVRALTEADLVFTQRTIKGDLGSKLAPPREEVTQPVRIAYHASHPLYDNCVDGTGSVIVTHCGIAPATTCVLLGDSYSYALLKYLPETFRRLVFLQRPTLPPGLLAGERPDVVISVVAERFMVRVPADERAADQRALERGKRAGARVRRPYAPYGTAPDCATAEQVEALRAHVLAAGSPRDAAVVSLMAYAGLRPGDVMDLRWSQVAERELRLDRRVPLWDVVAAELGALRGASAAADGERVVAGVEDWGRWRDERYLPAAAAIGLARLRPWALHNTYVHLRLAEGASPAQVAEETAAPVGGFAVARARAAVRNAPSPASPDEVIRAARTHVAEGARGPHGR